METKEIEKNDLRVGVIGVGNIGHVHAESLLRGDVPGMRLCALCDTNPEKRAYLAQKHPHIPVFADHKALLASGICDTVIVSTPHFYHPIIASDALCQGLHVISEKPAGVDTAAVRSLYETAKDAKGAFGIMFNQRTDPLFAKAKDLVSSGALGEPKRLVWIITNWYRSQAYYDSGDWRATWKGEGGGVLLNQAPHNLDLWQWIFGMPRRIRAFCYQGKHHHISVEDDATIYAEYENGAVATFITSTGEYPGTNRLEMSGSLGRIVIEHGRLTYTALSQSEREYCFHAEGQPLPILTDQVFEEASSVSGHTLILRNFAEHVRHGVPLLAPGTDGIYELMLSNGAYLSSEREDWVTLPFADGDFTELLSAYQAKESARKQKQTADGAPDGTYRQRWQVQW